MKKVSLRNKILTFLAGFTMLFGAGVSLQSKAPVETKAANFYSGTELNLKVNAEWSSNNKHFAVWLIGSGATGSSFWVDMDKVLDVPNTYKATTPVGSYEKLVFASFPAGQTADWGNKKYQTVDLFLEGSNNLWTLQEGAQDYANPTASPFVDTRIPSNTTLYVRPNDSFKGENFHHMEATLVRNGETKNVSLTADAKIQMYKIIVPTTTPQDYCKWATIKFTSKDSVGNNINETAALVYDAANNTYNTEINQWQSYTGFIGLYAPATAGINESKVRIWLDRSDIHTDGFVYVLRAGTSNLAPTGYEKALVNGNKYFAYYDVSLNTLKNKTFDFVVLQNGYMVTNTNTVSYVLGDNSKLLRITNEGGLKINKVAIGSEQRIYNTFFAKVLEGYLTCSSSTDNGYGAFTAFDANFLPKSGGSWNLEGNLGDVTINDYLNIEDYTSGPRSTPTNAYEKYLTMQQKAGAGCGRQYTNDSTLDSTTGVLILGAMFALSTAGYIFFRKKKVA